MRFAKRVHRRATLGPVQLAPLDATLFASDMNFDQPTSDHVAVPVRFRALHRRDDNLAPFGTIDHHLDRRAVHLPQIVRSISHRAVGAQAP